MTDKLESGIRVVKKGAPVGLGSLGIQSLMVYLTQAFGTQIAVIVLLVVSAFLWLSHGGAAQIRAVLFDLGFVNNYHPKRRPGEKK